MLQQNHSLAGIIGGKFSDYLQLVKIRLSLLVVFSASMSYLWATGRNVDPATIWLLSAGGFLVTVSSNIINQLLEAIPDGKMKRTASRPLAAGRMKPGEAIILAAVSGIAGLALLWNINILSVLFGAAAMVLYTAVYTPLKKISAITVVPGAIAGSLPVVIGCTAATGEAGSEALLLCTLQFVWQFPHTWSIAWLLNDEYKNAGFRMLPVNAKNKTVAFLILFSTFLLIPSVFLLYMYESSGIHVTGILALTGFIPLAFAWRHYHKQTNGTALRFMITCILYLPVLFILLVAERLL